MDVDAVFYPGNHRRAKVVVVTESSHPDYYREFVMRLQLWGRLDRVVYDEAHE